jgi:hypothetical protein
MKIAAIFTCLLFSASCLAVEHSELHKAYLAVLLETPETKEVLNKALMLERQAHELAPSEFKYAYNVGLTYERLEDYKSSENWYVTALKIANNDMQREYAGIALDDSRAQLAKINTRSWQPNVNVTMVLKGGSVELNRQKKSKLPKALAPYHPEESLDKMLQPIQELVAEYDRYNTDNFLLLTANGNRSAKEHFSRGIKDFYHWYTKRYFKNLNHAPIVVIFVNDAYRGSRLLKRIYPNSREIRSNMFLGVFNPKDNLIMATVTAGYGTFLHELMHAMLHADFAAIPEWLDEGMASLYERSQWQTNALIPLPNWRLDNLKPTHLDNLQVFNDMDEDNNLSYQELSAVRMLMLFLESKNQLASFYQRVKTQEALTDPTLAINSLNIDPVEWKDYVHQTFINYHTDRAKHQIGLVNPVEARFIQSALNRILGTQYEVDGVWGSNSRKQVEAFQARQGLQVDGKVGKDTRKQIKRVLASLD